MPLMDSNSVHSLCHISFVLYSKRHMDEPTRESENASHFVPSLYHKIVIYYKSLTCESTINRNSIM